jgi:RND superfamily putative drug exporter
MKKHQSPRVRARGFTDTVLQRSRLVVAALFVLVALGGLAAFDLAGRVTESNQYPGLAGWEANNAIHTEFGTGGYERPRVAVVDLPDGVALDDPEILNGLTEGSADITAATGSRVVGYADAADPAFRTEREDLTYLLVFPPYAPAGGMPGSALGEVSDLGPAIQASLTGALPPGTTVRETGLDALTANGDEGGLNVALKVGIAAALALVVLLWFFRSALAALPLLIALLAMPIAALGIWTLSLVTTVHETTLMMAPLLAIGIAVDYALIVTSRWREARDAGNGAEDAVREAMRTSGRAIAVSALAVAAGLATMIVLPIPILTSLGLGGTVTAGASALVTLTVLPLLLRAAGRRRTVHRPVADGRGWERLARWSMRHRIAVIAVAGGLLLALTGIATTINLATPVTDRLAQHGPAHAALVELQDTGAPTGIVSAFDVMTPIGAEAETRNAILDIEGIAGVVTSSSPQWRSAEYALLTVIPEAEGGTSQGADTIRQVRDAVPEGAVVGGNTTQQLDYVSATYGAFPWMLALVCLVTFVVVALAFRSLLLALKAIVLNLLSLGAVLGALVIVWQWGWGTEAILGVAPDGSIGTFVPVTVFAFLFGLTMDYEVFLLSRIKEEHDRAGDTGTAVARALGRTGRLITAAAVILFCSFASMAMTRELDVAVFASGVALGVLLDVTLIRGLLVPALIAAFGRHNWWFPRRRSQYRSFGCLPWRSW